MKRLRKAASLLKLNSTTLGLSFEATLQTTDGKESNSCRICFSKAMTESESLSITFHLDTSRLASIRKPEISFKSKLSFN